jgi:hypothetical protein
MSEKIPLKTYILRNIRQHLEGINPGNGYFHDLTDSVFFGRISYGDSDPLPMVSIIEPPLPPEPYALEYRGSRQYYPWRIVIQGFTRDKKGDRQDTEPSYLLAAEVLKRMHEEISKKTKDASFFPNADARLFGTDKLVDASLILNSVRPPDEVSSKAYFWQVYDLKIVEDFLDPFVEID